MGQVFVEGIVASARDAANTAEDLSALYDKNVYALQTGGYTSRSYATTKAIFDYRQIHPMVEINMTAKDLGISYNTASTGCKRLVELGILKLHKEQKRNKVYVYEEYLSLLRDNTQLEHAKTASESTVGSISSSGNS